VGDANVFRALTLLLAVCEQTLFELEAVDPPLAGGLGENLSAVRDDVYTLLASPRFADERL
jgi:hypothetical protein